MEKKRLFLGIGVVLLVLLAVTAFVPISRKPTESTRQAIALRVIGDRLLRQDGNFNSRVLPIQETATDEFKITFEKPIAFVPDSLVALFRRASEKQSIPTAFSVEVKDRETGLTTYSFEMPSDEIPCLGRKNPRLEYEIHVRLLNENEPSALWLAGIPCAFLFLALGAKPNPRRENLATADFIPIGKYRFHPKLNRLVLGEKVTLLTATEASVLHIFASRPNEAIAREILQNEVWESKGVIVGRSLDVFISRLRKKLSADEHLKIVSLHGTGYKLIAAKA